MSQKRFAEVQVIECKLYTSEEQWYRYMTGVSKFVVASQLEVAGQLQVLHHTGEAKIGQKGAICGCELRYTLLKNITNTINIYVYRCILYSPAFLFACTQLAQKIRVIMSTRVYANTVVTG